MQNMDKSFKKEFSSGISKTSKYILSHHLAKEYFKCYKIRLFKKYLRICSRCLGVYLGIFFGFLICNKFSFEKEITYILVLFLPVFALIDWHITEITNYKSKNLIRTLSGFLLGIAYSLGLLAFIKNFPDLFLIFIGFFYFTLSVILYLLNRK